MRALVQRVADAAVTVDGREVAAIGPGLLVLLAVRRGDDAAVADRLADRVAALRIFDPSGPAGGPEALGARAVLCISQFTLYGDTARGTRPSWSAAAPAAEAEPLYVRVCDRLGAARGVFGAHMRVRSTNDGPVTLIVEVDAPA